MSRGYTDERAIQGHEETLTPLEQARRIAALAREKLAEDVVILDMRPECSFTDYFVIATGRNARQTAAIWDEVHMRLKQEERLLPQGVDGPREGAWIVADYLDVVLHVFTPGRARVLQARRALGRRAFGRARRGRGLSAYAGSSPCRVSRTIPAWVGNPWTSLPPSRTSMLGGSPISIQTGPCLRSIGSVFPCRRVAS